MRIVMIIMIVLVLGALAVANVQQTNFKNLGSGLVFAKIYGKWVWQVAGNVKDLAVMAYNMKWLPESVNISDFQKITALNVSL
ncbi:MAG: hypothetical protein V1886_01820 [archaeon]